MVSDVNEQKILEHSLVRSEEKGISLVRSCIWHFWLLKMLRATLSSESGPSICTKSSKMNIAPARFERILGSTKVQIYERTNVI